MKRAKTSLSGGVSPYDTRRITTGQVDDPFLICGPRHRGKTGHLVAFDPFATSLSARTTGGEVSLTPLGDGVFSGDIGRKRSYRLRGSDGTRSWEYDDPYRFGRVLGDMDIHLIGEGTHRRLWHALGAHPITHQRVAGVHFAVWAPNARRVSVVGDFNAWDGRRAPMRRVGAGVWEVFLPGVQPGENTKVTTLLFIFV